MSTQMLFQVKETIYSLSEGARWNVTVVAWLLTVATPVMLVLFLLTLLIGATEQL